MAFISMTLSNHHVSPSITNLRSRVMVCTESSLFMRCLATPTPLSYPKLNVSYAPSGVLTLKAPMLEKPKLDLAPKAPIKEIHEAEAEAGGGDGIDDTGGVIGGGGGNDDDEYHIWDFDPEGEDGEYTGIFRRRKLLPEIFDRETMNAVLSEWTKTTKDLPAGLRLAYECGLMSSAKLTTFLCFNNWPSIARFVCRSLPQNLSRAFNGKVVADPVLPGKLILELAVSTCCSMWSEYENRGGERFRREWDLVLVNTVTTSMCNAFVVWSLAPCFVYEDSCRFQWQKSLQKLPNNVFDKRFDLQKRVFSFFYKGFGFFLLGSTSRALQVALTTFSLNGRGKASSSSVASALGHGLSLGFHSNLRYQLLCGMDRVLMEYFDVMGVAMVFGSAARILNAWANEASPLVQVGIFFPLEVGGTNWFLQLVHPYKQLDSKVNSNGELGLAKARHKRFARKKVTSL